MNPFRILHRHHDPDSDVYRILVTHSLLVANKARRIARAYMKRHPEIGIDVEFLLEAALLHDIGIHECDAPEIFCRGSAPYLRHGVIGREILESEGLARHALVCERHTGAGITREEVRRDGLPLPERDYLPVSLEEKMICVADKFFSKIPDRLWKERKLEKIAAKLSRWGPDVVARWQALTDEVLT